MAHTYSVIFVHCELQRAGVKYDPEYVLD